MKKKKIPKKKKVQRSKTFGLPIKQEMEMIEAHRVDAAMDAFGKAFLLAITLSFLDLRDNFGFGKKRLLKYVEELMKLFNCLTDGYIEEESIFNMLERECHLSKDEIQAVLDAYLIGGAERAEQD